jgi:hypothetical protein
MNAIIRTFIVLFLSLAVSVTAYSQKAVDEIGTAIGIGNVNGISRFIDDAVILTIDGTQATYSKSQAEMVLRNFFSKNSPKDYHADHSSGSKSCSYAIGSFVAATGNYRTYISVRKKDGNTYIQEIRIER